MALAVEGRHMCSTSVQAVVDQTGFRFLSFGEMELHSLWNFSFHGVCMPHYYKLCFLDYMYINIFICMFATYLCRNGMKFVRLHAFEPFTKDALLVNTLVIPASLRFVWCRL